MKIVQLFILTLASYLILPCVTLIVSCASGLSFYMGKTVLHYMELYCKNKNSHLSTSGL